MDLLLLYIIYSFIFIFWSNIYNMIRVAYHWNKTIKNEFCWKKVFNFLLADKDEYIEFMIILGLDKGYFYFYFLFSRLGLSHLCKYICILLSKKKEKDKKIKK